MVRGVCLRRLSLPPLEDEEVGRYGPRRRVRVEAPVAADLDGVYREEADAVGRSKLFPKLASPGRDLEPVNVAGRRLVETDDVERVAVGAPLQRKLVVQ